MDAMDCCRVIEKKSPKTDLLTCKVTGPIGLGVCLLFLFTRKILTYVFTVNKSEYLIVIIGMENKYSVKTNSL